MFKKLLNCAVVPLSRLLFPAAAVAPARSHGLPILFLGVYYPPPPADDVKLPPPPSDVSFIPAQYDVKRLPLRVVVQFRFVWHFVEGLYPLVDDMPL